MELNVLQADSKHGIWFSFGSRPRLRYLGTGLMLEMAGGLTYDLHGLTGLLAIVLMFVHAVWATIVLLRKMRSSIVSFHNSVVWVIWLIPYFSPMVFRLV
jgi:uncharacterized repeat protein (TIGR03987 family)